MAVQRSFREGLLTARVSTGVNIVLDRARVYRTYARVAVSLGRAPLWAGENWGNEVISVT